MGCHSPSSSATSPSPERQMRIWKESMADQSSVTGESMSSTEVVNTGLSTKSTGWFWRGSYFVR